MTKFKFAIAAIVLAVGVIGAFAFSVNEKEPVMEVVQQELYWFYLDGNGDVIPQMTEPELQSKESTDCPDEADPICARGFTDFSQNSSGQYVPDGSNPENALSEE